MAIPEESYDVVVIGSGVIGMELAILLKEAGIHVAIFERQAKVSTYFANHVFARND